VIHNRAVVQRLLHLFGGCTELWSSLSNEAEIFALRHTYGPQADCKFSGREPSDYVNSRLMILWGWSPADGTFGTNNPQYLHWAHQHGVRMVSVDPRATRTSLKLADEHVAIRPGTDAAMLIAMASGHREREPPRSGLPRPARAGLRRGRTCPRARPRARRIARISSASPTAS
jgi:anaerobic dimethyl sulfoxide reductase subunit A